MSSVDVSCVIVGAGCSGLALADALVRHGLPKGFSIALVDAREDYRLDHNWCFFGGQTHAFEDAVAHRWESFRVRDSARTVERRSERAPYCHVPADRFYAIARERIARANDLATFFLGEGVNAIDDRGDHVRVQTTKRELRARIVFDSRPSLPKGDGIALTQHFIGHEIETDRDVFDERVATLMDFDVDQSRGIHFMYVLPFTRRRALVESTFFSAAVHAEEVYENAIEEYLARRFDITSPQILSRERGAIPMTSIPFDARPSKNVMRIGVAGGFAKPSTGYAFLASLRFAEDAARHVLAFDLDAIPAVRGERSRMLDTIFLSYLKRFPELAPETFTRLFENTDVDALIRFLSERGDLRDDLRVMQSLPTLPFALEALRSHRSLLPARSSWRYKRASR